MRRISEKGFGEKCVRLFSGLAKWGSEEIFFPVSKFTFPCTFGGPNLKKQSPENRTPSSAHRFLFCSQGLFASSSLVNKDSVCLREGKKKKRPSYGKWQRSKRPSPPRPPLSLPSLSVLRLPHISLLLLEPTEYKTYSDSCPKKG